jgi:iron complex outermembrane recepter protein
MYSKSILASAVIAVMFAPNLYAQDQTEESEEIVVTGIRASLSKALDIKRDNTQIVDAIVAEDIGKFPDNNVVEALQRVTGVQTTNRGGGEVSGISIRGLTDIHTTVNGRDVYTGAGRAMQLQDIPASLLASVTVYKTRSADQVERGIAGSIDVKTHRPFNFDGVKVSVAARGIYADQPDKIDPNISALFSNRWETSQGDFGALVNFSFAETHYRDDTMTAGAAFPFFNAVPHPGYAPYEMIPGDFNGVRVWQPGLENGLPSGEGSTLTLGGVEYDYLLMRDAIFGTSFTGERKRPAASVSLQWAPDDQLEVTAEGFYTGYRNKSQNAMWFSNTLEHQDGNIPIPLVYEGTNIVKEHDGHSNGGFQSGDYATGKTDSYLYALGAKWTPRDDITVNSEVTYQTSKFTSEFFAMRFARTAYGLTVDYNDRDGVPSLVFKDNPATANLNESDMSAIGNWNASGMWDNGGGNEGDSITLTTDLVWELEGNYFKSLKVGGRYEERNAQDFGRGQDSWAYGSPLNQMMTDLVAAGASGDGSGVVFQVNNYFDGRANIFDNFITANGSYLLDNADAVRTLYGLNTEKVHKNFDVTEDSVALYATTKFNLIDTLSGEFGLRYVNYKQDMEFWSETGTNTNIYDDDTGKGKADKLLPSLVLNWDIADDVKGRFAYTQTLRMPNFGDLNPLQYFQDPLTSIPYGTGSGGNPDLKPVESTNYDLSLEWYFAEGSSLYAAVFRRDIEGAVIGGAKIVNRTGNDGVTRDYVLTTLVNAVDGELSGMEVGLVYFPDNLPSALDGFGVQASYTALDSSQKTPDYNSAGEIFRYVDSNMSGVSDDSYSVVLAYDKDAVEARLSYVWRESFYGRREAAIFANPIQVWARPERSLEFQLSYDVTDDLVVTFDATNLLDDVYQNYYGEGNQNLFNFGSFIYSKTYALGARYSF